MKVIYTKNLKQVTEDEFLTEEGFTPVFCNPVNEILISTAIHKEDGRCDVFNIENIPQVRNTRYLAKGRYEYFIKEYTDFYIVTILEYSVKSQEAVVDNIYMAIFCKEDEEESLMSSLINYNEESFKYLLAEHFYLYTDSLPFTGEEKLWYHNSIVEVSSRDEYAKMEEELKKETKNKRLVTYKGKDYKNLKTLCKELDIPYTRVSQNLRKNNKTFEQVIEQQLAKK